MTRDSVIPLDSYRLARYAQQIPCYICGEGNTYDAELCRHCCAPMALAHQVNSQNIAPRMVAAIGPSGVGKTVYLGMLMDMLSRQHGGTHVLARGAFSITLQQMTTAALARCEFPEKTPNEPDRWNWVHCQIRVPRQKRPVELIMPDLSGDALIEEINHPHTFPVIRAFLSRCVGTMVMIDALQVHEGSRDQDYFTMKLLSYLLELDDHPKTGWPRRPVALVFTKADRCEECFLNPEQFARAHTAGLWQHCQERLARYRYFAAGVAGTCVQRTVGREGKKCVPLRIEPRGIVEPFDWLIGEL